MGSTRTIDGFTYREASPPKSVLVRRWDTPRRFQGQIVTLAWAATDRYEAGVGDRWLRVVDAADRSVTYYKLAKRPHGARAPACGCPPGSRAPRGRRADRPESAWAREERLVREAVARHPGEFGLQHAPGKRFRVSETASYWSESYNAPLLYTQVFRDGQWLDYAKGTERELVAQKVPLGRGAKRPAARRGSRATRARSYRIAPYLPGKGPTATVFFYPNGEVEVWKTEDHARTRVFHSTGYKPGMGARQNLRWQAADVIGFATAYAESPRSYDRGPHELEQVYRNWWGKHGDALAFAVEPRGGR